MSEYKHHSDVVTFAVGTMIMHNTYKISGLELLVS